MSDALSPEMLAAIAAFPKDKIKVIPRGTSGYEARYVWHPASGDHIGTLRNVGEPQGWKAQRKRSWAAQKASVKREREARLAAQRAEVEARREQVARLMPTHAVAEIAKQFGVSVSTIECDLRALKKAGQIV